MASTAKKAPPKAVQPPLMATVSQAEEDLRPDFEPEVQAVALEPTFAHFAAAIGHVEAIARLGDGELVMEVARIAYRRGRQTQRESE